MRVGELAEQRAASRPWWRSSAAPPRRGPRRRPPRRRSSQPRSSAGRGERAAPARQPCSTPRASSHVPSASSRSAWPRAPPAAPSAAVGQPSAQGVERRHCSAVDGQLAERRRAAPSARRSRGEALGGPHRGRRRIVELVRQAGGRVSPRATSLTRARGPSRRCCGPSGRRRVMMCLPKGNHSPTSRPRSADGTLERTPSLPPSPIARYPASAPSGAQRRNAAGPLPRRRHRSRPGRRRWPTARDEFDLPSSRIHSESAGSPSPNSASPAAERRSSPAATSRRAARRSARW